MPSIAMGISGRGNAVSETITKGIRESLLQAGFTEAINFSFMSMEDLDTLRLDAGDPRRTAVQVKNPLRVEDSFMRTILAPSLIRNVMHNAAHGNKDVRLFEMARVFNMAQSADGLLPKEPYHIAAISCKDKAKALYKEETHDFYMMKGVLESMLNDIRVSGVAFKRSSEPFLHPGQSADIWIKDEKIGFCGVLSPLVVETLDIKAQKSSIVVTELCIDSLIEHFKPGVCYAPLPKFPAIERDSAIIVDASLEASEIIGWVGSYPSNLIEGSYIFDVYQGGAIPNGQKSIAFNVRYRALDRTLTDDEIDALHKALIASVLEKTKGHLRQ
jgi:phenylalanyl-tRNA synthetase beta chain